MKPALYLIPVPLGDTALDAVLPPYNHDIITGITHFIVEDIRSARRFLRTVDTAIDIDTLRFYELNEHTDEKSLAHILDPLINKQPMGVISEAGCPAVADPGALAVAMAHRKNLPVIPLVGPSSIMLALMASGCNGQNFAFNGYLPVKANERAAKLRQLESRARKENQTQIFIETPYRNAKLIDAVTRVCREDTRLCIAAGITTEAEYIQTKTIGQWKKNPPPAVEKIPAIFMISV